jgi:hypothetical protein
MVRRSRSLKPMCPIHPPPRLPMTSPVWLPSGTTNRLLWDPSQAVFKLKGKPITLKHWVDVYSRWKGQQWSGLKKPYSQWKVSPLLPLLFFLEGDSQNLQMIAEHYMEGSAEEFWQEFSANGKQMSWSIHHGAVEEAVLCQERGNS